MSIVVQGTNTTSQDDANQSVTFGGSGGTIALGAASGTGALMVSGVISVTFTDITIVVDTMNLGGNAMIDSDKSAAAMGITASQAIAPLGSVSAGTLSTPVQFGSAIRRARLASRSPPHSRAGPAPW